MTLVIAKLDRLSRNALPAEARGQRGRFEAVDLPEANDPTVGIMALVPRAGHFYRKFHAPAMLG